MKYTVSPDQDDARAFDESNRKLVVSDSRNLNVFFCVVTSPFADTSSPHCHFLSLISCNPLRPFPGEVIFEVPYM